jgi:hypothetical protein
VNSNNGDTYKVFNTVLCSILAFFEICPKDMLMIQGSDGTPEFVKHCRLNCTKKCNEECKNFNRRINIYQNYVDKNYDQLIIDYQFFGENNNDANLIDFEDYVCGKQYDTLYLLKRNT